MNIFLFFKVACYVFKIMYSVSHFEIRRIFGCNFDEDLLFLQSLEIKFCKKYKEYQLKTLSLLMFRHSW